MEIKRASISARLSAQSAMEYLTTYGWVILIIAIVLLALFELGIFNQGGTNSCVAQPGFVCTNPVYGTNAIQFTFGQNSGRYYYSVNAFVASQGENVSGDGLPYNATVAPGDWAIVGNVLASGETLTVTFPSGSGGQIPSNPPIGAQFSGYVWISYCLTSNCQVPQYAKVATLNAKESGTGIFVNDYVLSVIPNPYSGGGVSPSGGYYSPDSTVQITAVPASGYTFNGWTCSSVTCGYAGSSNAVTITMSNSITEVANFNSIGESSGGSQSSNQNYTATFNYQSGLPLGTMWTVTYNGVQKTASAPQSVSFNVPNGVYAFTINDIILSNGTIYYPNPDSGYLSVVNSNPELSVAFSVPTYTMTFYETGLPGSYSGSWQVTYGSDTKSASSPYPIAFTLPASNYTFTVPTVSASSTYYAAPAGGKESLANGNNSATITFGLPCATDWRGGSCIGNITYDSNAQPLTGNVSASGNVIIESSLSTNHYNFWIGGTFTNDGTINVGSASNGGTYSPNSGPTSYPSYGGSGGGGFFYDQCGGSPFIGQSGGNTEAGGGEGWGTGGSNFWKGDNGTSASVTPTLSLIQSWYYNNMSKYLIGAGGGAQDSGACGGANGGSGSYGIYIQARSIYPGTINAQGSGGSGGTGASGGGGGGAVLLAYNSTLGSYTINNAGGGNAGGCCGLSGYGGSGAVLTYKWTTAPVTTP